LFLFLKEIFVCIFQYFLFVFLQFVYYMPKYRLLWYLCWFGIFWNSRICDLVLVINFEKFSAIITLNISSISNSLFSFWYANYAYVILFGIFPQFFDILFFFSYSFFIFAFQFGDFCWSNLLIFGSLSPVYWAFFIFVMVFSIYSISFLLYIFAPLPIYSCTLPIFSIRAVNLLNIVTLNSLYYNPTSTLYLSLVLMHACCTFFLPLSKHCNFLLKAGYYIIGDKKWGK
jgi:hypothetical protein